jgi:putative oxidoreductase
MNKSISLMSRALMALIFLMSGFGKLTHFGSMAQFAGSAGLPFPEFSIAIATVIELAGGLALLLGFETRWTALALVIYLIPATIVFHVAKMGDPGQAQMQTIEVLKNLAIMGGLLKYYLDGAGALALDNRRMAVAKPKGASFAD